MDVAQYVKPLRKSLKEYLERRNAPEIMKIVQDKYIIDSDLFEVYTASPRYQMYITEFHEEPDICNYINSILESTALESSGREFSFVDAGCGSGFTGLSIALASKKLVTFHDFAGLGLDFISDYLIHNPEINAKVVPYGKYVPRHVMAIALDVLEHTGNHLCTLKWLRDLGDYVAISYPLMPYFPPFVKVLDEYVDDEAIQWVCEKRYRIILSEIFNGRRFLIYT